MTDPLAQARDLIEAGVPIFVARRAIGPDGQWDPRGGTGSCGYVLPNGWQATAPDPAALETYTPGDALCAVMGHGLDLVDVDPHKGGTESVGAIVAAGAMPTRYAVAQTPSGGWHAFVASMGVGSRDSIMPGLDIKAGTGGEGHGFAFIAPTVKVSKTTGELAQYAWLEPFDLEHFRTEAADDDTGAALGARVNEARSATKAHVITEADGTPYDQLDPATAERVMRWTKTAVEGTLSELAAIATWPEGHSDERGRGWEKIQADTALRLASIAISPWTPITPEQAAELFVANAPVGGGWTLRDVQKKWSSQFARATGIPMPAERVRTNDSGLFAGADRAVGPARPGGQMIVQDAELDVSSSAEVVNWMVNNLGAGRLSGVFYRGGSIVYTPQIGEEGYLEPRKGLLAESAASISALTKESLAAQIQMTMDCVKLVENKAATERAKKANPMAAAVYEPKPAMFPLDAARVAVQAPERFPALRDLRGVVHAPTFRPDGSLILRPGYDEATGLLFLPIGAQPDGVPENPSRSDVELASKRLAYMLQDFKFVSSSDVANYIGLLLTPMLRSIAPAPYKLGVIEAHQPGSGKTFLARAITSIHGGLMHSELPQDEVELGKTVASILDAQTAPVVVFDNVTGLVRSPTLAGLLTSPTFQGRRLGGNSLIEADNDRLWIITGNNANLGGDLGRRNLRVRIDPGVPNPELRTEFGIPDFENWVREHRGDLLWSLLVLIRHWVVQGMPLPDKVRQDSYGRWVATVQGILTSSGVDGIFDDPALHESAADPEVEEWGGFLEAVWDLLGDQAWTTKSLLSLVSHPMGLPDPAKPLEYDRLPSGIFKQANADPSLGGKSLGRWLTNRAGRWYGDLTIRQTGMDRNKSKTWRIERHSS